MQVILLIFNNTPFTFGRNGVAGLSYDALKDQIRWSGLKPKKYVNILHTCFNYYSRGLSMRG